MSSLAAANRENASFAEIDGAAVSFWIFPIATIAWMVNAEANTVKEHWKTSIHVSDSVSLIVGAH